MEKGIVRLRQVGIKSEDGRGCDRKNVGEKQEIYGQRTAFMRARQQADCVGSEACRHIIRWMRIIVMVGGVASAGAACGADRQH